MRGSRVLLALAATGGVAVASCGGTSTAKTGSVGSVASTRATPPAPPALCSATRATVTGRVADPEATELSGLVFSRTRPDVLWSHNDSGDVPRVFALRRDGSEFGRTQIAGAEAVDWEDIATGPAPGGGALLYLADIGDNARARDSIDVYRVPEPQPGAAQSAPAERLRLRYPDGAHDAEALLVDPRTGTLVIVTKDLVAGRAYSAPANLAAGSQTTLRRGPAVPLTLVTAGDVSANGRIVALRTYSNLFLWARRDRESLTRTLARKPCVMSALLLREGQGEAVALTAGGTAAYTTVEGSSPILRRYSAPR